MPCCTTQNSGRDFHAPLTRVRDGATVAIIDSLLSEEAVMAFEYGYSTAEPNTLVLWEGQFGDFANGAQVVIDQFISSGEAKWGRYSGLVLLLPHGYEGQGPEHSSARLERYLQLCALDNMQVCVPTTPAQMFHMLRRQMVRDCRKPLIVMTPKSLLRHKMAVSSLDELANGSFQRVIPDTTSKSGNKLRRIVLCSGKVYYDLVEEAAKRGVADVAIIRVEQLYPFPRVEVAAQIDKYPATTEVVWCQEEPMNQGAWYQIQHHHQLACIGDQHLLHYAGRVRSPAPAAGHSEYAYRRTGLRWSSRRWYRRLVSTTRQNKSWPLFDLRVHGRAHKQGTLYGTRSQSTSSTRICFRRDDRDLAQEGRRHGQARREPGRPGNRQGRARSAGASRRRAQGNPQGNRRDRHESGNPRDHRGRRSRCGSTSSTGESRSAEACRANSPAPQPSASSSAGSQLSPAGQRVASENKIDPAQVSGTGRGGQVTKEDLVNFMRTGAGATAKAPTPPSPQPSAVSPGPSGPRPEERVPMTRMRAKIAERLMQSKNSIAMLTSFNEINLAKVALMRKELGESFEKANGIKLGYMSFFVKAACEALKRHPIVNASVDGNDVIYHGYQDISVAVSTDKGLVTPVLRDAQSMSFADNEKAIGLYAKQAREGGLKLEDLQGGTFTITNGGTFGSLFSTPIVNPPQSAILGMHTIKERAIVENGAVIAAPMMYVAISYDHRIIDGKDAVLFLVDIKNQLENPQRMLLGL